MFNKCCLDGILLLKLPGKVSKSQFFASTFLPKYVLRVFLPNEKIFFKARRRKSAKQQEPSKNPSGSWVTWLGLPNIYSPLLCLPPAHTFPPLLFFVLDFSSPQSYLPIFGHTHPNCVRTGGTSPPLPLHQGPTSPPLDL